MKNNVFNRTNQKLSVVTIIFMFIITMILTTQSVFAQNMYYVGGTGASDSNPGTTAQPYATIQKAATVAVAGDVINIRTGTYRETITPTNSGTLGNPITYQPDAGATVVISGLNTADGGWTVHSGQIYKKDITLPVDNATGLNQDITSNTVLGANQVFKDGNMVIGARWPNAANVEALWDRANLRQRQLTVTWYDGSLTDNSLPTGSLVGGTIWTQGWYQSATKTITGHAGNTITYPSINPDLRMHQWYYVSGKLSLLDQANEWYYDPTPNRLYIWQPGGGSPTGIEYKVRNWGFDLRGRSNITINGITLMGCEIKGDVNTSNCTIDNIRARYTNHVQMVEASVAGGSDVIFWNVRQTGFSLLGSNNVIKNSEFKYVACQGIHAGPDARIENNLFEYINNNADYAAAISAYTNSDGFKVLNNTIRYTGRSALDYGETHLGHNLNLEIAYNDVSNWNMISYDGGAFYGGRQVNLTGTVIHHNWIYDSRALKVPNVMHSGTADHLVGICAGLYYDQAAGPTTNHHNVLWNNYESDFHTWQKMPERNAGKNYIYNNTFATDAGDGYYSHRSYLTVITDYFDVMRNNIHRDDVVVNWYEIGNGTWASPDHVPHPGGDAQTCLFEETNPVFVGTGAGGLAYRLQTTSPAKNTGTVISGITDGSVGVPDMGAYEFGGTEWVPGYVPVVGGGTVATPTFNPVAGTYTSAQSVTISTSTSGASIRYTTDGSTPTASSTLYSGAINISTTTTLKAIGLKSGMTNSAVGTAAYTINITGETFVKGINFGGNAVTVDGNAWLSHSSALSSGLTVVNGQTGTGSWTWTPTPVNTDFQNMLDAVVWNGAANMNLTQTISNGTYNVYVWAVENYLTNFRSSNLQLEGTTVASNIGTMAANTWQKYGPFSVTVSDGVLNISMVRVTGDPLLAGIAIFSVGGGTVATPTFSPVAGTYSSSQSVAISTTTPGATIRYTTDGSTPTGSSTLYTGAVNVSISTTLKAIGIKSGMTNSAVGTAVYTITGTTTINNTTTGTGQNQFEYVGTGWGSGASTGAYLNDEHYTAVTNDYYNVDFTGTQIQVYSQKFSSQGIVAYSIDGGAETMVDHYNAALLLNTLVYTSPTLADGSHTLKVRVTGTKNASSSGTWLVADRVVITSNLKSAKLNPSLGEVTGIEDLQNTNECIIYPNPSNGRISLKSNNVIKSLEIYNISGSKVFILNNINQNRIENLDISRFSNGIYFVKLFDGETQLTKKIIINKD